MEKEDFDNLAEDLGIGHKELESLALKHELIVRKRELHASDILFSICSESVSGTVSHNDAASKISVSSDVSVTRQALWKKCKENCLSFFKDVLAKVISKKVKIKGSEARGAMCAFQRVIVQDSTIVRLPARLFIFFLELPMHMARYAMREYSPFMTC